jgi:hypothetical protein
MAFKAQPLKINCSMSNAKEKSRPKELTDAFDAVWPLSFDGRNIPSPLGCGKSNDSLTDSVNVLFDRSLEFSDGFFHLRLLSRCNGSRT